MKYGHEIICTVLGVEANTHSHIHKRNETEEKRTKRRQHRWIACWLAIHKCFKKLKRAICPTAIHSVYHDLQSTAHRCCPSFLLYIFLHYAQFCAFCVSFFPLAHSLSPLYGVAGFCSLCSTTANIMRSYIYSFVIKVKAILVQKFPFLVGIFSSTLIWFRRFIYTIGTVRICIFHKFFFCFSFFHAVVVIVMHSLGPFEMCMVKKWPQYCWRVDL